MPAAPSKLYMLCCVDNDSNMCGSSDRLIVDIPAAAICSSCGYKTDLYFVNQKFQLKKKLNDLSSTYDGYQIASLRFVEAIKRNGLVGLEFIEIASEPNHFVVRPTDYLEFDVIKRRTRFESLCESCGSYRSVAGAHPAFVRASLNSDFAGSDVVFGSGNARSRLIFVSEKAMGVLRSEKLRGLEFEPVAVTGAN